MTQTDLIALKGFGRFILDRDSMFFLRRCHCHDDLRKPTVILRKGTEVAVEKTWRKGRAALLRYTDTSGKVWWSWLHAMPPYA